jgi:exonuclease III
LHDVKQWPDGPHCRDFFFITNDLVDTVQKIEVNTETAASDHQPVWLELG